MFLTLPQTTVRLCQVVIRQLEAGVDPLASFNPAYDCVWDPVLC